MNKQMELLPLNIIDDILSFDKYGEINLIVALGLNNTYIKRYSDIINTAFKTSDKKELMTIFLFMCNWRLESLIKIYKYKIDQNSLDNLPKTIWDQLSTNNHLRESFIIKNAHNLNMAKIKYFRKSKVSDRFHAAFPEYKNLDKCTECFEHDAIADDKNKIMRKRHFDRDRDSCERLCSLCLNNLCDRDVVML